VVVDATFTVVADEPAACEARIAEIVRWRREHQPGGANAGSVFRNPPGDSAGRLIESVGLKGLRIGGAVVSEKHANFIQAEAGATAADVRTLVFEVQRRVVDATGVRLEPALHFVGFDAAGRIVSDDPATPPPPGRSAPGTSLHAVAPAQVRPARARAPDPAAEPAPSPEPPEPDPSRAGPGGRSRDGRACAFDFTLRPAAASRSCRTSSSRI
jgi:hypothetical protein